MAIKFVAKKDLKFENGYILDEDNNVIDLYMIANQLNQIEETIQRVKWREENPKQEVKEETFKFQSAFTPKDYTIDLPDTPMHDAKVEESMKFMAETDALNNAEVVNEWIKSHQELLEWLDSDSIYITDGISLSRPTRFDLLTLGNPLELTVDDVKKVIIAASTTEF